MTSAPLRALLLGSSPRDAELVREALLADGLDCRIVRVDTRDPYVSALQEGGFDLIVCDHALAGISGEEALEIAATSQPRIPFLFFSGAIGEENAVEALKKGAADFVLKSNPARLPAAVRRALQEARERMNRTDAEEGLRASEGRYRRLFERNLAGVFRSTLDGRILDCNEALAHIFGYERPEELMGRPAADLYIDPAQRGVFLDRIRAERTLIGFETTLRKKDGSPVSILENVTLLGPETGESGTLEGTMIDITERKRLEEQFRQAQKMEAIGRLAGGVAHDFNNILTAILGYSDLLGASLSASNPLREEVEEIRKAAERAAALTRQLLAFGRRQVLILEVLDLNLLVREMERMLRRVIGEDIEIRTRYDPELGRVRADRGQLEQVLINLIINARDAMPSGGTITIETGNAELDGHHLPAVMLAVGDTGCGMDAETRAHIFEPFYTTKEKGKGTGLGLATVYGIVEQSGGHVRVSSEPGRGATFRVFLPRIGEGQ